MPIRKRRPADDAALADLWERSVRATHDFLGEDDIQLFFPLVRDSYLPTLDVWLLELADGTPADFIGTDREKVEMLFVEPTHRGQGIGRQLLDHARALQPRLSVDVNEQNPQAHGFYRHYGFEETGRSQTDGQGQPLPIIHMRLKPA